MPFSSHVVAADAVTHLKEGMRQIGDGYEPGSNSLWSFIQRT